MLSKDYLFMPLLAVLLLNTINFAKGQNKAIRIWNGSISNAWQNSSNWVGGVAPVINDDVVIPTIGVINNPAIGIAIPPLGNVTIEPGRTLTISYGLHLTGNLINDGSIIIGANGFLVQEIGSTLSGTGIFSITTPALSGNHFVGSPIENPSIGSFGFIATGPDGGQIIPNLLNPCNADSIDLTSPSGNFLELRENPPTVISGCAQSLWHVRSTGNLENGRGYSLTLPASQNLNYSGWANNGPVILPGLTRQSGSINQWNGAQTRG